MQFFMTIDNMFETDSLWHLIVFFVVVSTGLVPNYAEKDICGASICFCVLLFDTRFNIRDFLVVLYS